jgi:hypothetical protein
LKGVRARVRGYAGLIIAGVAVLATSCSSPAASSAPSRPADTPPTASPTPDERPLQALLPSSFRGTPPHTFAVGEEMLERLRTALGVAPGALESAFASDHGPAFVQMYALRASGLSAPEMLAALPEAAYPDAEPGSVMVSEAVLGTRNVTVITEPSAATTLGTYYCLVDGEVLVVAQALAEPVAESAFAALPGTSRGRGY